jgi:hypothetical protein
MAACVSSIAQRAPISVTLHYIAGKPAAYHLRASRASSGQQSSRSVGLPRPAVAEHLAHPIASFELNMPKKAPSLFERTELGNVYDAPNSKN